MLISTLLSVLNYNACYDNMIIVIAIQTIGEIAFMMGLKRNMVDETVKEQRADELSAMYNMMMDQKKINKGSYNDMLTYIHTHIYNMYVHKCVQECVCVCTYMYT